MRDLTVGMQSAMEAKLVSPIALVSMETAGGTIYVWSGNGELQWNGQTWQGVGDLGGISAMQEAQELRANNITLTLNGVSSSLIAMALADLRQGKRVSVFLGALDPASTVMIADPVEMFGGLTDVPTIDASGDTCTIGISVESRLIRLEKNTARRWTHEDQQIRSPGDRGFEYVPSLQDMEITWGR
ncbi:hypothetical protein [Magnetococcus sp. PR-3]|uniref:hypothetical protein n=1 Tax=Magnetococcus sp. PR-3 TaxID=3120355 RepID=UPI002FCDFF91